MNVLVKNVHGIKTAIHQDTKRVLGKFDYRDLIHTLHFLLSFKFNFDFIAKYIYA